MLRSVFSRAASLRAPQTRVLQKDLRPFSSASAAAASEDARVTLLVQEFRKHAHLHARVNPIRHGAATSGVDGRAPFTGDLRGLRESDSVAGHGDARTVGQLVAQLQAAYCGSLAVEAEHCERDEASWLAAQLEATAPPTLASVASERLARFGEVMLLSQAFDEYLHRKLRMVKRYGLEGGESLMVAMDALFQQCVASGIDDVVIGMPHRGRNNLLTVLLDYPPSSMFAKMRGQSLLPPGAHGLDDVLSHIAQSADVGARYGGALHVSLLHNPSHLEAVDPVALGKARARQEERLPEPPGVVAAHDRGAWPRLRASARRTGTLCVQMHGDGAVAGQGVVAESALLARLPGYTTLGTIHIVVNNQVAFTCEGEDARSSRFATDIAKVNGSPVLRVNGEDPIAVARAAELAVRFRAQFGGDVDRPDLLPPPRPQRARRAGVHAAEPVRRDREPRADRAAVRQGAGGARRLAGRHGRRAREALRGAARPRVRARRHAAIQAGDDAPDRRVAAPAPGARARHGGAGRHRRRRGDAAPRGRRQRGAARQRQRAPAPAEGLH
jgi:probable 2-oxoglutarate dehydrogenase E1 component DHKTD1